MYEIDIMTLFDLTVGDMMNESVLGRAQERDLLRIEAHQIRDYTLNLSLIHISEPTRH